MYKPKIESIVLNYLIQEGYKEAALSFAKEIHIDLSKQSCEDTVLDSQSVEFLAKLKRTLDDQFNLVINNHKFPEVPKNHDIDSDSNHRSVVRGFSTINERMEIKHLILKGKVTLAIAKISEYFPTVLDSNNLLHFNLLRLSLIEMIRNHKVSHLDSDYETEKQFLGDVLSFVRNNLINKVTKSFKLLKKLEITMSLLCFNLNSQVSSVEELNDLPQELKSLFDLSLRTQCYRLVNKAILDLNKASGQDELQDCDADQKYFDKLKYGDKLDYDFSQINQQDIEQYTKGMVVDSDIDVMELVGEEDNQTSIGEESSDEESDKFRELALDSKLERLLKVWSITEDRLNELKSLST